MLQGLEQPLTRNALEVARRLAKSVAGRPQGGDVGNRAAGAEGTEGVVAVLNPLTVKIVTAAVDQTMEHRQNLPLHGRKSAGSFHLDQVLIKSGQDSGKGQHEVGEGGGHVPDEPRRRRVY